MKCLPPRRRPLRRRPLRRRPLRPPLCRPLLLKLCCTNVANVQHRWN